MPRIRVVLADDHPVVRSGIRGLLEKAPDIDVVGEASTGIQALQMVKDLAPDVLLLDMEMPGATGVDVARSMRDAGMAVRILALSAYDDEQHVFGLLESGAAGYLTKAEAPKNIVNAIQGVARGEEGWFSRSVTAKVMQEKRARRLPASNAPIPLSAREQQVLRLVAEGWPDKQIATELGITQGTVKTHVANLKVKLGVERRQELPATYFRAVQK